MSAYRKLTDAECIKLVRESGYMGGLGEEACFGPKNRFCVVLAVPYGTRDGVRSVKAALEAFRELLSADDWDERQFQVFDSKTGKISSECRENFAKGSTDVMVEGPNGKWQRGPAR